MSRRVWSAVVAAIATLLAISRALSQCGQWQTIHTDQPDIAIGPCLAFDSARAVSVLWGALPGPLFEWDGVVWRQRIPLNSGHVGAQPSSGTGSVMIFDSARGRTVLYTGDRGETWEWDGNAWTHMVTPGPPARAYAAMAFDSGRARVVLFGGQGAADTWEWDGATWTQRSATGPGARSGHSMAYDPDRACVVLFGGQGSTSYHDTWEWDGSSWTQRDVQGPTLANFSMVYDSALGTILLVGGYVIGGFPPPIPDLQTWTWDGSSWSRQPVIGLPARQQFGFTFDSARGRAVLYGGFHRTNGYLADTWEWDGTGWAQVAPTDPAPNSSEALVYDSDHGLSILWGGNPPSAWAWDGGVWTRLTTDGPSRRSGIAMAYDQARHETVLFGGGSGAGTFFGETWVLDSDVWRLASSTGPSPRTGHAMAYDSGRGRVVLFGGGTISSGIWTLNDETWEWDGTTWSQVQVQGPNAQHGHTMCYDSDRRRIVLLGDGNGLLYPPQTWEFDGQHWSQPTPFGGPNYWTGRSGGGLAYDSSRHRTILFGGCCSFDDLWEWDGAIWTQRFPYQNGVGYGGPMAYDTVRTTMVLFGGENNSATLELPSVPGPPIMISNPYDESTTTGGALSLRVVVGGDGPFTYSWFHVGSPVHDGPGGASSGGGIVSGSNGPLLTITNVRLSDEYSYFCRVANTCAQLASNAAQVTVVAVCGSADFDGDGIAGTDRDIEAFFACLAGNCCDMCGTADFNADGDNATDADIEAFFRVLAGGTC